MTANQTKRIKKIAALKQKGRKTRKAWRPLIYHRDGFRCAFCGGVFPAEHLSVDHWWPTKLGGSDDAGNMVTSCRECNDLKDSLPPLFFRKHRAELAAAMKTEAAMFSVALREKKYAHTPRKS